MNLEKGLQWGLSKVGKVKYSMNGSRNGSDGTGDCSGYVYQVLIESGATKNSYIPNTDSMHEWLLRNGFKLVSTHRKIPLKKGDVVIWGLKGHSGGSNGHTGIMLDSVNWLECTAYLSLGVTKQNYEYRFNQNRPSYFYIYRLPIETTAKPSKSNWIDENGTFTLHTSIILRSSDNTSSNQISVLTSGSRVKYNAYRIDDNGYVWIRQPRSNGYGYMATGTSVNGRRTSYWGTFS